jgi:hypothetical protein
MKLPVHTRAATIHDADGQPIATCLNAELAQHIAGRINEFARQYARGVEDATLEVNARRDREAAEIRRQAEARGYDRAMHEESLWNADQTISLAA